MRGSAKEHMACITLRVCLDASNIMIVIDVPESTSTPVLQTISYVCFVL